MPESPTRTRLRREARERDPDWIICDSCGGEGVFPDKPWGPSTYPCSNCDGEGGWYDEA